jgi:hypothetical protein
MWDTEIEQVKARATDANRVIEMLTEQLGQYTLENPTERKVLAIALLKASIDMGAAATRLLMLDPIQYGGAAEAMFRPQLERYLRAVYFGSPKLATDAQLRAFVDDDKIDIYFEPLAKAVGDELLAQFDKTDVSAGQKFADILILEKKDLHGAVHGGKMVALRYMNDHVAYDPTVLSKAPFIESMMLLALLACSQAVHMLGSKVMIATPEFAQVLSGISSAWKQALDEASRAADGG